jgi:hypothetical protein
VETDGCIVGAGEIHPRQTAHVWIRRYQDAGHDLRAMQERSRRPSSNPRAVSLDMQDRLAAARKQHPRWGPLKLCAWLVERHPQFSFPSVSGIGAVLRRRGMTVAGKPPCGTALSATIAPPFADCERPNDVWCMDFKGGITLECIAPAKPQQHLKQGRVELSIHQRRTSSQASENAKGGEERTLRQACSGLPVCTVAAR